MSTSTSENLALYDCSLIYTDDIRKGMVMVINAFVVVMIMMPSICIVSG